MLVTVDPAQRAGDVVMRAMFEARKRVFVDLLGWDLPVLAGRFEIDQFDDLHARYLIVADPQGQHLASARLLPTTRPHILDTLFPALCDEPPPQGPDVYEITRFCLERGVRASARRHHRDELVTALAGYALANGIRTFVGVAEIGWLQQILAFGWQCGMLGDPRVIEGMTLGALRIDITPDTPALLARAGIHGAVRQFEAEAA
jgi:acyl-homoserine lactone synthase